MAYEPGNSIDLPEPGNRDVEDHAAMSRRFLEHAQLELEHGNRLQASQKIWGAAAHALKAIAIQRGWRHRSNTTLFDIGVQVGQEFDQEEDIVKYLGLADAMHKNFYENDRRPREIRIALESTRELVGLLDDIRAHPERPFTVKDNEDRERLGNLLGLSRPNRPAVGTTDSRGFSRPPAKGGDDDGGELG